MSITLIKLLDGSEIIGTVVQNTSSYIVIDKPLMLHYRFYVGGVPTVSFSRFMMFATSGSFTIQQTQVITLATARKAFADYYLECVEEYYSSIEESIDAELRSLLSPTEKEQAFKRILEMMPVDKVQKN